MDAALCMLANDPLGPCVQGQCDPGSLCISGNCFGCLDGDCSACSEDAGLGEDASTDASVEPDTGSPDDGAVCVPLGGECSDHSQCCSDNCILRVTPGFCCVPGGCP